MGTMEATGAAFWRDTIAAAIEMRIGRFLHQDLKCEKGVWNHKCYLRYDKKNSPGIVPLMRGTVPGLSR